MNLNPKQLLARDVWRRLEDYSLGFYSELDNDATYVEVCNITGRGILVSIGATGIGARDLVIKITVDGSSVEKTVAANGNNDIGWSLPMMKGYQTACKVEMKLDAVGAAYYQAVTLEE